MRDPGVFKSLSNLNAGASAGGFKVGDWVVMHSRTIGDVRPISQAKNLAQTH